jgi:hypothetical protein
MDATIFCLSFEVREAALDLKALRRKVAQSGDQGYKWMPAEANARQRMLRLSLEQGKGQKHGAALPHSGQGKAFLKLA